MSEKTAHEYLAGYGRADDIRIFDASTATVELAVRALGVEEARIAKTLSFLVRDTCILVVTAGDVRIDNKAFKKTFGTKARMLDADAVKEWTGHEVGGVCPFGLAKDGIPVYLDGSLKRFATIFPACGSPHSAIELTCDELYDISQATGWVDVCSGWKSSKEDNAQ